MHFPQFLGLEYSLLVLSPDFEGEPGALYQVAAANLCPFELVLGYLLLWSLLTQVNRSESLGDPDGAELFDHLAISPKRTKNQFLSQPVPAAILAQNCSFEQKQSHLHQTTVHGRFCRGGISDGLG